MSCNCPNTNTCPTSNDCLCGIDISLYLNDVLTNSYESGGYVEGGELFFQLDGTNPLNKIRYNSEKGRWELYYFSEEYDQDIVIGVYYTDSLCPISSCDWDLDCISFIFRPRLNNYVVTWDGQYLNGRKTYSIYGSVEGFLWTFYWDSVENRWELIADNPTPTYGNAYNNQNTDCVPTDVLWSKVDTGGPSTYETFPLPLDLTGYEMKITAIECGCCDESVIINITVNNIDYSDVVAEVVKDEYGNILGVNGKQYYLFELPLIPDPVTFYLYYTGTSWIISNSLNGEGDIYVQLISNNDCPFGFYSIFTNPNPCDCLVLTIDSNNQFFPSFTATANASGTYGGYNLYEFVVDGDNYYVYYEPGKGWYITLDGYGNSPSEVGIANAEFSGECPDSINEEFNWDSFIEGLSATTQICSSINISKIHVKGSECFDCCDYYTPRNRNLLKKKKAIFVDEISSIRNKEIFGLKCGPEWSDLFKKHLIFDVLWCLPYGVLCDDEEQCLINDLNENCNC